MGNKRKLHLAVFPHLHIAKIVCISLTFASYVRMMQMYFYIDNLLNLPEQIQCGEENWKIVGLENSSTFGRRMHKFAM